MPFDPMKFVSPVTPIGSYDYGAGFRDLANQRMQQSAQAENARQADQSEAGVQKRHDATTAFNEKSLGSQNARFSLELEDTQRVRQGEYDKNQQSKVQGATAAFRDKIAKTDFSGADAMIGSLAEMGVEVSRSTDDKGMPIYRVKAPTFGERPGVMDSATIIDKIEGQESQSSKGQSDGFQFPGSIRQISGETEIDSVSPRELDPKNPFEPAGTSGEFVAPPQPEANDIFTPPGEQPLSAAEVEQQRAPVVNEKNPYDPYMINTGDMLEQNRKRIDPMLAGIVNAVPGRFQNRMKNYMGGVRETGLPLDQTLESMQKPLDTVAGLMKGELSADAAYARAAMSQGSQESNRDLRIIGMTRNFYNKVSQDYDLPKKKQDFEVIDGIIARLRARNPQDDKAVLHDIRNLNQKGVATQPDIDSIEEGNRTLWERGWNATIENFITSGMNETAREGLIQALELTKAQRANGLQQGAAAIMNGIDSSSSAEEQRAGLQFMAAQVPESMWPEPVKEFFGRESKKVKPSDKGDKKTQSSKSAVVPASDVDELQQLMDEQ
jgi:hypothetical protein